MTKLFLCGSTFLKIATTVTVTLVALILFIALHQFLQRINAG